jgi:hypothetical protein
VAFKTLPAFYALEKAGSVLLLGAKKRKKQRRQKEFCCLPYFSLLSFFSFQAA